jgi:hypothetical protein
MHYANRFIFTLLTLFATAAILGEFFGKEIDNYICGPPETIYEPEIEHWRLSRPIYELPFYLVPWGIARGLWEGNLFQYRYFPNYRFEPRSQFYLD